MKALDPIFKPKSVAIIGATSRKGSIGHEILHNLIVYEYNGKLFPVNPKYEYIHSIKAFPYVLSIPDEIDLAIIVVPKESVLEVAEDCGKKKVKALVVISAGFKEMGSEGLEREKALIATAEKYGFRIVGPNCMGLVNATEAVRLNATFAPVQPEEGVLAMMSQSGALGVAILLATKKLNIGLSYFISVGNKIDISGNDLLEYWEDDEYAKVIALYLEDFGNPRQFTLLSKRISKKKPIVVVKSGTSAAGARAASSHTGALAGMEIAVGALLRQCGVIRVSTIEEMMDLLSALTRSPFPKGDRVAILTNAGGPAIMAADAAENEGLQMAVLKEETRSELKKFLPAEASVHNPVDMLAGAGASEYERAADLMLADGEVDMLIVIFVPPIMIEPLEVVRRLSEIINQHDKTVLMVLMAEDHHVEDVRRKIKNPPPFYIFPESAVRVASHMRGYQRWRERPEGEIKKLAIRHDHVPDVICAKQKEGGGFLSPPDVYSVLEEYGFPVCRSMLVPKGGDILAAAENVGFPLVLKVDGKGIIHKSDVGGVEIGIKDAEELRIAWKKMEDKLQAAKMMDKVSGYFVQEMAASGKEVILGMTMDRQFGPLIMFGMGGKYVEIMKDISFRVTPVTDIDAWEMVRSVKGYPLLEGVRGEDRVDIEFIVESIQRLAQLVDDVHCLEELDINPFIVTPDRKTCRVVDARIKISGKELYWK
jgi:acetyl coenzyme A synthetase (ADP forming)-like protein